MLTALFSLVASSENVEKERVQQSFGENHDWSASMKGLDRPLLIAGLGNPGACMAKTRHNLGYLVLDSLAAQYGVQIEIREGAFSLRWHRRSWGAPSSALETEHFHESFWCGHKSCVTCSSVVAFAAT